MKTFFRWVPTEHAEAAVTSEFPLQSHNGSAMWIFSLDQGYRPSMVRGRILIAYDVTDSAATNITTKKIARTNFGDGTDVEPYKGENGHPDSVIIKANEPGALGLGRYRQKTTSLHTTARYATRREVRRALGASSQDDISAYKPPGVSSWT